MIPVALRIKNFRSVRARAEFLFPQEPGLYFMQGVNAAEPRLEANGAGKSTVWDALTWCWFGKTARGLKAGDVCNWDAGKGTEVEFEFHAPSGEHCAMTRTWSPNSWTMRWPGTEEPIIDLTKEKDNPALGWLSLSFESWLVSVLSAQGQPMFLDLKRDAQAALLSDALGLDRWLDYSARASKAAGEQDKRVRGAERDQARLTGELAAIGRRDFRKDVREWDADRLIRLSAVEAKHTGLMAKRKGLKDASEADQEAETNARAWVARSGPDAALEKDYGRARADVSDYLLLKKEREADAQRLMADVERYRAAKDTCPACGQRVSRAHVQKEVDELTRKAQKCLEDAKGFVRDYDGAVQRADAMTEDYEVALDDRIKARDALDEAQRSAADARRAYDLNERELDRLEDEAARITEERNPYADMEERERADGQRIRRELDDARERLDAAGARHDLLSYWVRGFKELRLSLIAEAMTELEIEVNSCVDALGLVGWELEFRVDRETKGGSIQRGFDCFVRSPHNSAAVPWEAWSGGEAQRLRLAGNMGLADLVRSRTGAGFPLEVWDEPTEGLSAQGINDLLECLSSRARREGRGIWVVDHRSHDYGGFSGGAVVVKGLSGSIITQTV